MQEVTLKTLIEVSKDGEWGKGEPQDHYVKMAVIRGTDFESARVGDLGELPIRYIPPQIAERKTLQPFDIVLETAGGSKDRPTGRTLFIKPSLVQKSELPLTCASFSRFIRIDPKKADPAYIFWVLQHLYDAGHIRQYHTQHTGVARFQYTTFSETEPIALPPFPTQRKIASILSAYDDLIENNTRRIKILEEMTQALYREWFVRFRFPGHEGVRLVESELGLVPEGWEVQKLGVIAQVTMGQSPESRFYNTEGDGLPFHQGVADFGGRFLRNRVYTTYQGRLAQAGDVLFSVRAPVGRMNLATETIVIGRGLSAIRSRDGNQAFLFQQLQEQFQEEDTIGGGTIFKSVTKDDVLGIKVLAPTPALVRSFEELVSPMFKEIRSLTVKNTNLSGTRDLLLPKLISGELDVKGLEIAVATTA